MPFESRQSLLRGIASSQQGGGACEVLVQASARCDTEVKAVLRNASAWQVMEELIAKSKAGKAARQMQKEEDLTATDVLDASFQSLLQAGDLSALMKEKGARHDRRAAQAAQNAQGQDDGDAEFDRVRRELAFESRARVRPLFLPWKSNAPWQNPWNRLDLSRMPVIPPF